MPEQTASVVGPDLHFDPPGTLYVARTGAASVEVGLRLQPFLEQLCAAWEPGGDDVAVWLHQENRCRLVALLRDSLEGEPCVIWL